MPFGKRGDEVKEAWQQYWAEEHMTNFPRGLSSHDWDHIEGKHLTDEEQERVPTLEEVQAELRRLSEIRRARRKARES